MLCSVARRQLRGARPAHLPITIYILELLFRSWSGPLCNYCSVMLWAACALGFFGFLPSGEFTTVPTGNSLLLPSDVRVDSWENPSFLAVTLCSSKTDSFGAGCTLYIGRTQSHVCPVRAVLGYLVIRADTPRPLFVYADGTPLTHVYRTCCSSGIVWRQFRPYTLLRSQLQIWGCNLCSCSWFS